ncbi:hypothetical protein MRB53_011802 [Persea americana]|uniref:Uncharacterized protein n=1 Tax=Persea americana TaxID=3435 RepID=A0ACC2LVW1_PERAE|nr:hypothetical protein MRB53_011802 [Persea americana]
MAFWISTTQLPFRKVLPLIIITLFFLLPSAHSINFNFTKFERDYPVEVNYSSDADPSDGVLDLTKNKAGEYLNGSIGRAIYKNRIPIWDSQTGNLTHFNTQFSFIIHCLNQSLPGDGFTFFLSPNVSTNTIPSYVSGGNLGIYSDSNASDPKNQIVAVEFDTYPNPWDPSSPHVGININSRVSETTSDLWINSTDKVSGKASVSYSASTKNLSVFLSYDDNPGFGVVPLLIHTVDLREILPEWVYVGFSATTGVAIELHRIRSWEFNSSLEIAEAKVNSTVVNDNGVPKKDDRKMTGLIAGLVVCGVVSCAGLGGLLLFGLKKKRDRRRKEEGVAFDVEMDDEFEKGTGPKRFSYKELLLATRNFSEDGKLGEGGFGGVYKGFVGEMNLDVAVKRVSRGSKQGKKEYVSEVKTISRLRHRNLVQLLGWCHEHGELLLIYELMPNGSLDSHLFHEKRLLGWAVRYKIAMGLASALLYLHEEWEQCVVHRDIKSSNVMLDSNFNAKLGDFGLARLVDHEHGLQTTEERKQDIQRNNMEDKIQNRQNKPKWNIQLENSNCISHYCSVAGSHYWLFDIEVPSTLLVAGENAIFSLNQRVQASFKELPFVQKNSNKTKFFCWFMQLMHIHYHKCIFALRTTSFQVIVIGCVAHIIAKTKKH